VRERNARTGMRRANSLRVCRREAEAARGRTPCATAVQIRRGIAGLGDFDPFLIAHSFVVERLRPRYWRVQKVETTVCRLGGSGLLLAAWQLGNWYLDRLLSSPGNRASITPRTPLHKFVKRMDVLATIFTLKCFGKNRGWVERCDIYAKTSAPFTLAACNEQRVRIRS
jgi:hypothetical protein